MNRCRSLIDFKKKGQCLSEWNERSECNGERHLTLCFEKVNAECDDPFIVDYYYEITKIFKLFQISLIEIPSLFPCFLMIFEKSHEKRFFFITFDD